MKRLMLLIFLIVFAIVATITPMAFYNVTENDSGSNKAIYNLDEANAAIDGLSSIINPITVTINKWKDRDLAYSIGQINFIITGRRIGDIWSLTIKASDLYDFTEWRVLSGGFTLGDFANDFGHILSDFGMINKYRYYVDFQLTLTI